MPGRSRGPIAVIITIWDISKIIARLKSALSISRTLFSVIVSIGVLTAPAIAGPPYLTDDADPLDYQHWEAYLFTSGSHTRGTDSVIGPGVEVNYGIIPNAQVHLVVPESYYSQGGAGASGLGDIETGIQYRFINETRSRPKAAFYPMAELATGDQSKGLGNGKTWYRLPLWIEKTEGRVTLDTGGGVELNSEEGQRNSGFGGFLTEYTFNDSLSLGGELYVQGAQASVPVPAPDDYDLPGDRESSVWNVGGVFNFTPDLSLLFSVGHSYQGEGSSVYYLSLYRTWGPGSP